MKHCFGRACAAALIVAAVSGAALAQDKVFRSVDVVAGKQVRLGVIGNVSKDCTPGPMPEIKVVTPPKHGSLAIRSGKTKAGALARCPTLEAPVQGVFYRANPKSNGDDEVVYEVRRADGRNQSISVKVTVSAEAKPATKPQESTDL